MARLVGSCFLRWLLSFLDVNGDNRLTFADLSVLVAGFVFTLKMVGIIAGPDDPTLWTVFMVSICSIAGITKVVEALKPS